MRPEIQGLRAVAVLSVVIYHLQPLRLGGGFVGVDVFFAISGFLITAHLLREVDSTGRLGVPRFWARRLRRLLPAALLVLVVSGVGIILWSRSDHWEQLFTEVGASALYLENWKLASDSVDYLAGTNVASPVQHFWSLSVEEQFYIVWPLLIVLSILVARRFARLNRRVVIGVVLGVITLASFVWSVVETTNLPASAYFETTTRAWEFGAGALLAYFAPLVPRGLVAGRTIVSWVGWLAIAFAVLKYTEHTPFPSYTAALPVLGTLAVIWAGSEGLTWTPTRVVRLRPIQFIGDISYSLYLWHWPLIVFVPVAVGIPMNGKLRAVILVAAILLAWASKRWVEDPIRRGALARAKTWRTFAVIGAGMAIVVAGAGVGLNGLSVAAAADHATFQKLLDAKTRCLGAAAIAPSNQPCVNPQLANTILPSVQSSLEDVSPTWNQCQSTAPTPVECVLGVKGGTRVLLVGDSHAHQWITAFQAIATKENWEIHLIVRGSCPFSDVEWNQSGKPEPGCAAWNKAVEAKLAREAPYKYVFTSMRTESTQKIIGGGSVAAVSLAGFRTAWQPLIDRGATIVGLRDTPNVGTAPKSCVRANPHDFAKCGKSPAYGFATRDYLADAAAKLPGAVEVDMSEYFCTATFCPAVIGGVLVDRDNQHMTQSYATTLGPYLAKAITSALATRSTLAPGESAGH